MAKSDKTLARGAAYSECVLYAADPKAVGHQHTECSDVMHAGSATWSVLGVQLAGLLRHIDTPCKGGEAAQSVREVRVAVVPALAGSPDGRR